MNPLGILAKCQDYYLFNLSIVCALDQKGDVMDNVKHLCKVSLAEGRRGGRGNRLRKNDDENTTTLVQWERINSKDIILYTKSSISHLVMKSLISLSEAPGERASKSVHARVIIYVGLAMTSWGGVNESIVLDKIRISIVENSNR